MFHFFLNEKGTYMWNALKSKQEWGQSVYNTPNLLRSPKMYHSLPYHYMSVYCSCFYSCKVYSVNLFSSSLVDGYSG